MPKDTAILFSSSNAYAFALFTSIKTFLANSPQLAARSDLYVYTYRWDVKTKDLFRQEFGVTLVDFDLPSSIPHSKSIEYFTPALFARFEGFALLQKYKHVVCMDSDILVQKELVNVLEQATQPIGMTLDGLPSVQQNFWGDIPGYNLSVPCFNAGFIVLHHRPDAARIHQWLYDMLQKYAPICYLGDQGLINLALQAFNITPTVLPALYNLPASRPTRLLKQAYIIHATGPRKFWQYYYFDEWYKSYARWAQLSHQPITIRTNTPAWDKLLRTTGWGRHVFFQLAPDAVRYPGKFLLFCFKRLLRIRY